MVQITDSASTKIAELLKQEESNDYVLRLQIVGGGCSGFQYRLAFVDQIADDEQLTEANGVKLVIDPLSMRGVEGSVVDYVETDMGEGFKVDNPNVIRTCGCGHSFEQ